MSSKKILVVDDSLVILKTLSHKLRSQGYTVVTAEDGASAASAARRERPDLILLDINFPPDVGSGGGLSWDGFQLIDWLRRMEELTTTPILIMTSNDPAVYGPRALAAGAMAFFPKPIDHAKLLETIRGLLLGEPAAC